MIAPLEPAIEMEQTLLYTAKVHRYLIRQFLFRRDYLELHPFIHRSSRLAQLPFVAYTVHAGKREPPSMFRPGPAMGIHPRIRY